MKPPNRQKVSVLCPTIPGREDWLARFRTSLIDCGGALELVKEMGGSNWGEAINLAAEKASGDYFFLASDDLEVLPGWWQAAVAVCDKGLLPAPKVFNTDGSLQSCGEWETLQGNGDTTEFSRFPFMSREQWGLLGPLLPIHFSDVWIGTKAREQHGIETIVAHGYQLVHHMVDEGRRDYRTEENLRLEMEAKAREGVTA